jgi:hypothetical protein
MTATRKRFVFRPGFSQQLSHLNGDGAGSVLPVSCSVHSPFCRLLGGVAKWRRSEQRKPPYAIRSLASAAVFRVFVTALEGGAVEITFKLSAGTTNLVQHSSDSQAIAATFKSCAICATGSMCARLAS